MIWNDLFKYNIFHFPCEIFTKKSNQILNLRFFRSLSFPSSLRSLVIDSCFGTCYYFLFPYIWYNFPSNYHVYIFDFLFIISLNVPSWQFSFLGKCETIHFQQLLYFIDNVVVLILFQNVYIPFICCIWCFRNFLCCF